MSVNVTGDRQSVGVPATTSQAPEKALIQPPSEAIQETQPENKPDQYNLTTGKPGKAQVSTSFLADPAEAAFVDLNNILISPAQTLADSIFKFSGSLKKLDAKGLEDLQKYIIHLKACSSNYDPSLDSLGNLVDRILLKEKAKANETPKLESSAVQPNPATSPEQHISHTNDLVNKMLACTDRGTMTQNLLDFSGSLKRLDANGLTAVKAHIAEEMKQDPSNPDLASMAALVDRILEKEQAASST